MRKQDGGRAPHEAAAARTLTFDALTVSVGAYYAEHASLLVTNVTLFTRSRSALSLRPPAQRTYRL